MKSRLLTQITNPFLPTDIGSGNVDQGVTAAGKLIGSLIGVVLFISFLLALGALLVGGISWITAGGEKATLESARNKITHAIVGLIIVASVWAIMVLVGKWLGFDITKLPLPTISQ